MKARPRLAAASLLVSLFVLLPFVSASCGGFSTEEAEARCDQEQLAREEGGCFTEFTYDDCVAAFEECGEDVTIDDSCPLAFVCPE